MYGGRGSSKSDFTAKKLIYDCLRLPYFRYLLIRKVFATVKNSQWQTIYDIVHELGLQQLFTFNVAPLEIKCVNGNKFIAVGCDDIAKIKSIKDPTGAWWEEDLPEEGEFITVTTSIRTTKAKLQEIFTINPEVEGNYEDHWFWQKFFGGRPEKNFSDYTEIELENQKVRLAYTVHHSTYHDNRFLPIEFKAYLEELKKANPYYYTIYTLGEWGNKMTGGRFYRSFDRSRDLTKKTYDKTLPIHVTFDFNVRPYMAVGIWQVVEKRAHKVDEIAGKEPINNTIGVCREFTRRYSGHIAGLFVYGDPAGFHEDTRAKEKNHNDYYIIAKELGNFQPQFRVAKVAPPVVSRGNFINEIFAIAQGGIQIQINEKCVYSIMDYIYLKENPDGTKFKEKGKDDTGVISERYGHFSDGDDYFLTTIFNAEFNLYLRGNRQSEYSVGEVKGFERR